MIVAAKYACPSCGSPNVYMADGHYICVDCGTVVDYVYYAPPGFEKDDTVRRRLSYARNNNVYLRGDGGARHMRYVRLRRLVDRHDLYRWAEEERKEEERKKLLAAKKREPLEVRIGRAVDAICADMGIPRAKCAKAVELLKNKRVRLAVQSSRPKTAAAALLAAALGLRLKDLKKYAHTFTVSRLLKKIRERL